MSTFTPAISPTPTDILASYLVEDAVRRLDAQVRVPLVHSLHGGVYTRTARLEPGITITSVLIQPETTLVLSGDLEVLVAGEWVRLRGFHVLPARANRRQVMRSEHGATITMIMPTTAKTVEEAEREFTPEFHLLQSQGGEGDIVINTHQENQCQE